MEADQPAQAIARRFDLVLMAWRNAGDDRTAQAMANRLCQSWFDCDCATLASRQPPADSLTALTSDLPCTARVMASTPAKQAAYPDSEEALKRLADAVQDFFRQLRQVQDMPGRQVSPTPRPIFEVAGKPDRGKEAGGAHRQVAT